MLQRLSTTGFLSRVPTHSLRLTEALFICLVGEICG
jgi:hypothetical protein